MSNVDIAKAVDGLATIIAAWGSFQAANAALNKYLNTLINEQRDPNNEEWDALIARIEQNQEQINQLAS